MDSVGVGIAGASSKAAPRVGMGMAQARQSTPDLAPPQPAPRGIARGGRPVGPHRAGGKLAADWSRLVRAKLLPRQHAEGHWEPERDARLAGGALSRILCTAAVLFALEAPRGGLRILQGKEEDRSPRAP